jgi:nicotinamide mononucleotide adenylyltransferase
MTEPQGEQAAARQRLRDLATARKRRAAQQHRLTEAQARVLAEEKQDAAAEREAVRAAVAAGVRQMDIAADIDRSREHIRKIMKGSTGVDD